MKWTGSFVVHPARVLVVDDHAIICQGIAHVFGRHGIEAAVAVAADDALDLAAHLMPDCAVLDWKLLGSPIDGDAVAQEMKAVSPNTPSILISSFAEEFMDLDSDPAAIEGFFHKQNLGDIARKAARLCRDHRSTVPWRALEELLAKRAAPERKASDHVRNVIAKVCDALDQPWDLAQLSKASLGLSPRRLTRRFKEELHLAPLHFVECLRGEAEELET